MLLQDWQFNCVVTIKFARKHSLPVAANSLFLIILQAGLRPTLKRKADQKSALRGKLFVMISILRAFLLFCTRSIAQKLLYLLSCNILFLLNRVS